MTGQLERARWLAATGRHEEALVCLADYSDDPVSAALLRAKVLAQMGQYGSAQNEWISVLTYQPNNEEAKAGLARLRKLMDTADQTEFHGGQLERVAGIAALAVGGLVLVLLAVLWSIRSDVAELREAQERSATRIAAALRSPEDRASPVLKSIQKSVDRTVHELSTAIEKIGSAGSGRAEAQAAAITELEAAIERLERRLAKTRAQTSTVSTSTSAR